MTNDTERDTSGSGQGNASDRLKDVAILNEEGLTLGLPTQLFWGGIALSAVFGFLLLWLVGLLFGIVWFISMYAIHKDDPRALPLWVRSFRAPKHKYAGSYRSRRMRRL